MKNTVDRPVAASAFADSKPHYAILDGLRGVAALVVIWYHVFEGFATSPLDQKFNHGYLAVDFFFILSGFGHLGVGWSLTDLNLPGGFLRLMFSFGVGLLMSRGFRPWRVRGAFWLCSLAIIFLLSVPRIGSEDNMWLNGLYEAFCVVCVFPLLVYIGASGQLAGVFSRRVYRFLGDISYPVYIIHYPFMYLFYAWTFTGVPFSEAWPWAVTVFLGSIMLAYIVLKAYDEPLRKWLGRKWLRRV